MKRLAIGFLVLAMGVRTAAGFGFEDVQRLAADLAARAYASSSNQIDAKLRDLNFDQYSAIQFVQAKALWRNEQLPFYLEFFPTGYTHRDVLNLHEIDGRAVRDLPFDPSDFRPPAGLSLPANLGFAGFKINQPVPGFIEVAAFMDGTYFRMLGRDQDYGTSARGLLLNITEGGGEEFPVFTQFWICKPAQDRPHITVYALMDSPSVAGAYCFVIHPGLETVADVRLTLYPRRAVNQFGIAPLTSMFLYGKNGHPQWADFRPEVHDADGLLMHNGRGEWIWRPLDHGKMTRVNAFQDDSPRGFGLMQRDRNFEDYQDLVERYQRRPSVWVQPKGTWGKGAIELVELASDLETSDNVSAFWVPAHPPAAGSRLDLEYELHWTTVDPSPANLGHVHAARIGRIEGNPPHLRFVVDFDGAAVESIPAAEKLSAAIFYGAGAKPIASQVVKNPFNQTWRLVIEIIDPTQAVNLSAHLTRPDASPLTETWNYTWQP